jgi:hypothetical protein
LLRTPYLNDWKMNYVDPIIKYLSDDLSHEEAASLEKEMESNAELKQEFEELSAAWKLVGEQLRLRDEEAFRKKLEEAMSVSNPGRQRSRPSPFLRIFLPLAVACSLTLLLILFLGHPGKDKIYANYYHPTSDFVLLAYQQESRGTAESDIRDFLEGRYEISLRVLSSQLEEDSENHLVLLYYLLSAMELERQEEVLTRVMEANPGRAHLPDQSITWYSALALIKSERQDEALRTLEPLTIQQGPYRAEAQKLKKVLLK